MTTSADIIAIQLAVIRTSNSVDAALIADRVNLGTLTIPDYIGSLINQATNSTKPALIVANYVEGVVPVTARVDSLAAFSLAQYSYGAGTGVANPLLYAYQALGAAFSATTQFATKIAGLTLEQLITTTYLDSLGVTPTAAQVAHFVSQYTYFYNLYVGAGLTTAAADTQAKGAVVGQILYYGANTPGSSFATKVNTWLYNAGSGTAAYGVAL